MQYECQDYVDGIAPLFMPPQRDSLPLSIFLLLPFLIGTVAVSALPGYNYLVVGLGALCAVSFLMASVREGFFVPTELKYLMAFFFWGIVGIFFARYPFVVIERLWTVSQLVIMTFIISYYARNTRCVSWLFLAILIGVLVISVAAVITGEFNRAEVEDEEARLSGLVLNANAFAVTILYGIVTLLYFFRQVQSKMLKLIIIGIFLVAVRFVIASGSRKGFIGLTIVVFCWFILTYGKELRTRPALVLVMCVGVAMVGVFVIYQLRDTVLMERLLRLEAEAGLEGQTGESSRMVMLRESIQLTLGYPIFGVGLNHFFIYSVTGKYAHNNYAEVFSTTGIPGGVLYYLIYVQIFCRLYKVSRLPLLADQKNLITIFKCLMLLQLFMDIGVVSYPSKINWTFLAIIIGGLNYLQRSFIFTDTLPMKSNVADCDSEFVNE